MKTKSKFAGMVMLLLVFALSACSGGSNGSNGGTASSNPDASKPGQEASTGTDQKEPVTIEFMGHGNPNEKRFSKS